MRALEWIEASKEALPNPLSSRREVWFSQQDVAIPEVGVRQVTVRPKLLSRKVEILNLELQKIPNTFAKLLSSQTLVQGPQELKGLGFGVSGLKLVGFGLGGFTVESSIEGCGC